MIHRVATEGWGRSVRRMEGRVVIAVAIKYQGNQ